MSDNKIPHACRSVDHIIFLKPNGCPLKSMIVSQGFIDFVR